MTAVDSFPAYAAFETQLRTLCLKEFPCGPGKWKETKAKNIQQLKTKDTVESKFSVTLKDYGSNHEKTETLQEYVSSKYSPWHLDYSWSKEAKELRELAVKSPWLVDDNFVLSYFKTLRIIDKQVTEVDADLLKFVNLDELTLSANLLETVNSKNLPPNLRVLELCANRISDLSALCVRPPTLIHLGLGFNKVSFMGDYLTGDYWPFLLSLDLSHNNLSDLLDVVRKLGTLPKLRNLILQGNPLSLIAGYRGYTIDSLRKLNILDDIMISADERHHYKGLAKRREYILDEAKVTLEVTYIKGVPMPEEIKNPEDQPEYPVIERKYYLQFQFLTDAAAKAEVFQVNHDDLDELSQLQSVEPSEYSARATSAMMTEDPDMSVHTEPAKNVNFTAELEEVVSVREPTETEKEPTPQSVTPKQSQEKESVESEEKPIVELNPINLGGGTWAEEIELNDSLVVVRDDLLALRDFFKQGMEFSVVEEMDLKVPVTPPATGSEIYTPTCTSAGSTRSVKSSRSLRSSRNSKTEMFPASTPGSAGSKESSKKVQCFPDDSTPEPATPTGTKKGTDKKKDDKKIDKSKMKQVKQRQITPKRRPGGKDDKKGKKKKEPEIELKRLPPTFTTLATWHMPLEEILEGEYTFQSIYQQGGIEVASTVKSVETDSKKGGKKDGKGKPGTPKKKDEGKGKDGRRPSEMKGAKDDKGKDKGGKGKPVPVEEEEDTGPPPPLEVQVLVRLHHWKTALDSLKEEEEKNKALEEQQQA